MRWSLILPTLITILSIRSFVSLAVVTPSNLVELESRTWGKGHSKTYRKHAADSSHEYSVGESHVTCKVLNTPKDRQEYGQGKLKESNTHADHIFEDQMFKKHLQKNGVKKFEDLPSPLQEKLKTILNAPENMALVPAPINMAKGLSITNGLADKFYRDLDKLRDSYMKSSYPSAIDTAKKLDQAFKTEKDPKYHTMVGFEETLRGTMKKLGLLKPDDSSLRRSGRLKDRVVKNSVVV